jgi:hypothetical protein
MVVEIPRRAAERGDIRLMNTVRLAPPARTPIEQLLDAVLALSDDPRPANVERYLAASRTLEDSKPSRSGQRRRTRRTTQRAA